jgi:hypothetical protein
MKLHCHILVFFVMALVESMSAGAQTTPRPALTISPKQHVYRSGERIAFEYRIENTGKIPFYLNPSLEQVSGMDAGVRVMLFDEQGRRVGGQIVGDTFPPDYKNMTDIVEYVQGKWFLLRPNMFYGASSYYPTVNKLTPGKYRLTATYFSNILYFAQASQRQELSKRLRYPLMVDTVDSNEIWIRVSE